MSVNSRSRRGTGFWVPVAGASQPRRAGVAIQATPATRNPRHPSAFTLVEMLIAMALTLILVYAIAEFYAYVGTIVKDGRAMIEMNNAMRTATVRLKTDMELLTVPVVPWADDGSSHGYFAIYELGAKDWDINGNGLLDATEDADGNGTPDLVQFNITSLHGDSDDMICMTIRSPNEPFTGQHFNYTTGLPVSISSPLAEVIWFTGFSETNGTAGWQADEPMFLYRRQMLIRPDLGQINVVDFTAYNDALIFLRQYWSTDGASVSASIRQELDGMGNTVFRIRANTLLDLSRREHRFAHNCLPGNFPNAMLLNPRDAVSLSYYTLQGDSLGEDRVLSNLIGFDVRVFDPTAPLRADNTDYDGNQTPGDATDDAVATVQPGDPGWAQAVTDSYPIVGYGAFVDLYYSNPLYSPGTTSTFSGPPAYPGLPANHAAYVNLLGVTYDTWAMSYERDGYTQLAGRTDFATNGLDDVALISGLYESGVDDPGERETSPPYAVPLRGIQVRIRMIEPGTRQMRQATVGADFIQE